MLKFTIFDILLFSIIGISTLLGGYRGAIRIIIGILVVFASILSVVFLFPFIGNFLGQYIENKLILNTVTIFLSFVVSMIIFSLIGSKISSIVRAPGLLDNFLGLILGLLRGLLMSLVIFGTIILLFALNSKEIKNAHEMANNVDKIKYPTWLTESFSFNYLENAYKNILSIFPEEKLKNITFPEKDKEIEENNDKDKVMPMINQQNMINDEFELQE